MENSPATAREPILRPASRPFSAVANRGWRRRTGGVSTLRMLCPILLLAEPGGLRGADGGEVFALHCAPCHGYDGKARTPAGKKLGAKDLTESRRTDAEVEQQILRGVKDAQGAERMPAFKDRLATEEVAAVVAFVKTLRR